MLAHSHLRRLVILGSALLALLALAACDSEDEASDESGPYVRILELIPDDPEVVRGGINMGDLALARELVGVEAPPPGADGTVGQEVIGDYFYSLPSPARQARLMTTIPFAQFITLVSDSLGVNLLESDQWFNLSFQVDAGHPGLNGVIGNVERDAVQRAIEACDSCDSPALQEERGEWQIYGWGEDGSVAEPGSGPRFSPPLYDDLGFGGRIAFKDGTIVRAPSIAPVRAVAGVEAGESLAANEDFRLVAEHLEDEQALWVNLFPAEGWRLSASADYPDAEALREAGGDFLGPFVTWAYAQGYDADTERAYNIVVLAHETEEDAERSAEILPTRLGPAIEAARANPRMGEFGHDEDSTIDVRTEGRILIATIRGTAEMLGPSNQTFIGLLLASE